MVNLFSFLTDSNTAISKPKVYKCCDCRMKYQSVNVLYKHILNEHRDNIPDGIPVEQYYFNRKRKISHGPLCVICKKHFTEWNPKTCKYHRFCSDECKKKAGELFHKNYRAKFGKDYTINTPEQQQKLQNGRRIAGVYKFTTGGEIKYGSSYESHFLDYFDRVLGFKFKDIERCQLIFYYNWVNPDTEKEETHFYMPDYYMPEFNLIIEIKDGGSNPNMHPKILKIDKSKEACKDAAVINSKAHNYIKICDKDYVEFNRVLELLRDRTFDDKDDEKWIICIPKGVHGIGMKQFFNMIMGK